MPKQKLHSCVKTLKTKGKKESSAYAICQKSTKGKKKSTKKKGK
jgi:hypothetical protein